MKQIATTYVFASSSNPKKTYQTLQYVDGSLSCDCSGWTKRVQPDGTRTCRHVRAVDAGVTVGYDCLSRVSEHKSHTRPAPLSIQPSLPIPGRRVFDLT